MSRRVVFKASYWHSEETIDGELLIYCGGLTEENKTVFITIHNFTPFVYLELPKGKWGDKRCENLISYFQKTMNPNGPLRYKKILKKRLHFQKKIKAIIISFPNEVSCRNFSWKFSRRIYINNVGTFEPGAFKVHEYNVDSLIKFSASKKLPLSGWIKAKEMILEDEDGLCVEERKYTTADIDMHVDWDDVEPCDQKKFSSVTVNPKYVSFDIECYSSNPNSKLPDYSVDENVVFQISMIVGYLNDKNPSKRYLLTLYDPHDIPNTNTLRFKSEKALLLGFRDLVQKEDPDIFISYNGMKFDWNYMMKRAQKFEFFHKFSLMSRIKGKKAEARETKWTSKAYGTQKFSYFECHGRTNVDVMLEVTRNYKLPKYSLNHVAEYFLGENKVGISARQLFMCFQFTKEFSSGVQKIDKQTTAHIRRIFPARQSSGIIGEYRKELLKCKDVNTFNDLIRKALYLTGVYCDMDTQLPIRLVKKLTLWTTMEAMSKYTHVPMSYLHTRGKQVQAEALLVRQTLYSGFVLPSDAENGWRYQGATVMLAIPGDYKNVAMEDFESLYPTTMIAYNICPTTIVSSKTKLDKSEYRDFEWEDHVGCEHDPFKRKKKKNEVLCQKRHYRFRRVKYEIEPDGTVRVLNQGLIPKLLKDLISGRKSVKKQMYHHEAKLKMQLGKATESDMSYYKKMGWTDALCIKKGSLSQHEENMLRVKINVLNAEQLALKLSCNSMYGVLGVKKGVCPFTPGAETVTAMGRYLLQKSVDKINQEYKNAKLVYGDTDSVMFIFEGCDLQETFKHAEESSKMVTHYLKCHIIDVDETFTVLMKNGDRKTLDELSQKDLDYIENKEDKIKVLEYTSTPINLELEAVYGRFLLLTKKRYATHSVNRRGEVIKKISKGMVTARRNNSLYLRKCYDDIIDHILENKTESETMYRLYDWIHALFTSKTGPAMKNMKKNVPYVKNTDFIIYTGVNDVMEYAKKIIRTNEKEERFWFDENGEKIEPDGPLDPRLVYPNYPQCLLALKMIRRGDVIPPNTRLEYLFLENEKAIHLGEKAEDYTYFIENRHYERLRPDCLHYIEKQLAKPITELITVKYGGNKKCIPFMKLEDEVHLGIEDLNEMHQASLKKIRTFRKKIDYILNANLKIDHKAVIACKKWKARDVLNRLYKQYNLTKRPVLNRPWRTGDKLPMGEKYPVMFIRRFGTIKSGAKAIIVKTYEETTVYDLKLMDTEKIVKNVPRKMFVPYVKADRHFMRQILQARAHFRDVIRQMKYMLSPVEIEQN